MGVTAGTIAIAPFIGPIKSVNALAQDNNKSEKFFNIDKQEWIIRWWSWMSAFPKDSNPIFDKTGELIQKSQPKNEPVFFLAGGYFEDNKDIFFRDVNIPKGKGVFFPVICSEWSYLEYPQAKTTLELKTATQYDIDQAYDIEATLNGKPLPMERITTNPFYFYIQKDDFAEHYEDMKMSSGITQAVSDGYWVFIEQLEGNNNKIHFKGSNIDIRGVKYSNEVTYNIHAHVV